MLKKLWDFLGSVKLAIILIIIFSLVAFIGIIIPQGLSQEQYIRKWGEVFGQSILFLGIDHIFSTYWFYFLLELLSINVLICSTTRLFKNIRNAYRVKFWLSPEKYATFKHYHTTSVSQHSSPEKSVITSLKRRLYTVVSQHDEKGVQICAVKGKLKAYGSFLFHIGIVILFLGGLYGRMKGHTYHQRLKKGEVVVVENRDFLVRCDGFQLEKNLDGSVKDYKSKLALLNSDSTIIKEKTIEVNAPLSHRGIRFYQSSYGLEPETIENVKLLITGPDLVKGGITRFFSYGREVYVPHSDLKLYIYRFIPDFVIDTKTKQVYSRSRQPHNPAFKVLLSKGSDTLFHHWLFEKFPGQHAPKGKYSVSLIEYTPEYFTGIQIRDNPGVPLIWTSIFIMTFGILVTFYSTKETVWVFIEPEQNGDRKVHICCKLQEGFAFSQTRFEKICQYIEECSKKS